METSASSIEPYSAIKNLLITIRQTFHHDMTRMLVHVWAGFGTSGQQGQGGNSSIGDALGTMGDNLPTLDLGIGRTAVAISLGAAHSCAGRFSSFPILSSILCVGPYLSTTWASRLCALGMCSLRTFAASALKKRRQMKNTLPKLRPPPHGAAPVPQSLRSKLLVLFTTHVRTGAG